jgi:branched-chain amino acid transport system permease protein
MEYLLHVLVLVCIYAILAVSLDIIVGQMGLLSIAQAAFYAVGAYTSALLAIRLGIPFVASFLVAMAVAAVISLVVSLPSLRLQDDYFALATFAFQMILLNILTNWIELTRGPLGIAGIPHPIILGWHVKSHTSFTLLAVGLASLTYIGVHCITNSPYGRVLHAIREDEVLVKSIGKNALYFKVTAFAVSAGLAGMAGSLYAHYITYIDPTNFTIMESILILSMVIIGGAGSFWGPVGGALVLVTLPEILRFVGMPSSVAANVRQILYGGLLVAFMMLRPQGLMGKYAFGQEGQGNEACP